MTPLVKNFLHIERRTQPFLYSPYHGRPTFHAHPEFELTYIVKGRGKRIIGNKLSPYSEGDMVFIGANVPHVWLSEEVEEGQETNATEAIVLYINPKIFEQLFELLDELEDIKEMTQVAARGLFIYGNTRKNIADKLEILFDATGYEKIEGFMNLLHTITTSREKECITDGKKPLVSQLNSDRLPLIIDYIHKNLSNNISLDTLARLNYMTTASFCRYFKARMNISPFQYILEERMQLAQKLLIELDKPVYEIARHCGYNSDSHFCKIFKAHYGISPYRYKSNLSRISMLSGV